MTTTQNDVDLLAELAAEVIDGSVLTSRGELDGYRHDKSPFDEIDPLAAVVVSSEEDVAAALRFATRNSIPVIARGGAFSLGGTPTSPGDRPIVIDTRSLNRLIEIDESSMTVTAECGILMSDLHAQVAARGYEVHTVAVPRAYTTLGGVLSGVCGGGFPADVAEVGGTGQFVHGLRVILADGSIIDTNAGGSNVHRRSSSIGVSDGPQLTPLFIGDGGALGVKVQATIAIAPARRSVRAGAHVFEDMESAIATMTELQRVPEAPYTNLYLSRHGDSWSLTYTARASSENLIAHHVGVLEDAIARHGGRPGNAALQRSADEIAAMDPAWAEQFIRVDRGAIAAVFGNRDFRAGFAAFRSMIEERVAEELGELGVDPIIFISPYGRHAVWCAITLPYDATVPGVRAAVGEATLAAYDLIIERGGWSEPHQGRVSNVLAGAWSPAYRSFVQALRHVADPEGVLNRGLWDREPSSAEREVVDR